MRIRSDSQSQMYEQIKYMRQEREGLRRELEQGGARACELKRKSEEKISSLCELFQIFAYMMSTVLSTVVWLVLLPWNITMNIGRWAFKDFQQEERKIFGESNPPRLTSLITTLEKRIVFLERLLQHKQWEADAQHDLNRHLVKTIVQDNFDLASKTGSGFGNVETKLTKLEEILRSETMTIGKKIELSTARVEEHFMDMKKQIAMLGLAVVRGQHKAPCGESNHSTTIAVSCQKTSKDHPNSYEPNQKVVSKERNHSTGKTLFSRTKGLLWALFSWIKIILGCAMVLFTMSAMFYKPMDKIEDETLASIPVNTVAFIFTNFISWLFHSVA